MSLVGQDSGDLATIARSLSGVESIARANMYRALCVVLRARARASWIGATARSIVTIRA